MPNLIIKDLIPINQELKTVVDKKINTNFTINPTRSVEKFIEINPQIRDVFNKNETLLDKDVAAVTPEKFGVLGHIDPTRSAFTDALIGVKDLRKVLGENESVLKKAVSLLNEISEAGYIDKNKSERINQQWKSFSEKLPITIIKYAITETEGTGSNIKEVTTLKEEPINDVMDLNKLDIKSNPSAFFSTGLFSLGNETRADIKKIDVAHEVLMAAHTELSRLLNQKRNELIKLDTDIPVLQRKLANLNQERIKALGESKMVVALVTENWRKVESDYERRKNILTNHRGIYYTRVNETPYGKSSLLDVDLRYGRIEDLVPGIAISHLELPDEIEPYIEAIVDMPITNWRIFNDAWQLLPSRVTVQKWLDNRRMRLNYLVQQPRNIASKFVPIMNTHQAILQDYARFPVVFESSLQAFYRQAVQIISLEDLLTGTPHQLRGKAQEFRNQLDQASHLLLSKLQKVKPGIRMDWATAAELDQLDLRNPQRWPGMEEARAEDISNMRTLIELVNWWWRQLNDNASSASVTAVRNLLRAAFMVAVGDDPKEMLHGYLQVIPNLFRSGDLLRANLNRHAPIGTVLHLINERDELVGKLRVEDADERGTVVSIAQVYREEIKTSLSQYSLVGINAGVRSFV